ncbi:MAG: hypothetical protein GW770_00710 [Candidatus Altiarchaeum hamiconexum]|nr:hypothetical protein [Candidatus Altarchaeum hamiconexum]
MSKIVLYSHQDIAGENISKFLDKGINIIFGIDEKVINLNDLPAKIYDIVNDKIDLIIVASRHKSESKKQTLCVHSPGNFSDAKLGGDEKCLSIAPALSIREALIEFKKQREQRQNLSKYDVTLEVTHHGPTLNFPIVFVEVGSCEDSWNDLNACEAAGKVIKRMCDIDINLNKKNKKNIKVAIGIGGNHYAGKFTKILLNKDIAFGHIMPKYNFNEEMIEEMISKTIPKPEITLIDWNGLNGEQRNNTIKRLEQANLEWRKV